MLHLKRDRSGQVCYHTTPEGEQDKKELAVKSRVGAPLLSLSDTALALQEILAYL